ncbi:MAG TPA: DUF4129 domain-containing protein [Pseudolysinimonas sp.]|nr:DUF4129 domain-containing protein [Pseudolysinimonas sp.]
MIPLPPFDVPVDPDAPEAREWLADELSKAPYQSAKPTFIDVLAQQIFGWFDDLVDWLSGAGGAPGAGGPPFWILAVLIPVAVIAVLAFLVYGVPRLNRRSRVTGTLFGEDDIRDAAALRRAAQTAADAGDYTTAVAELFRALARSLAERSLVHTDPGTTASAFAGRAATVFPAEADALRAGARDFDAVRYLGHPGTREQWDALRALEARVRSARPALEPA